MIATQTSARFTVYSDALELRTADRTQFIDITQWVGESLRRSGIGSGLAQVQVLHTTASILVNENEPLLLNDFKAMLERLAPENGVYEHDDMGRREGGVAEERPNGRAHARALIGGPSTVISVLDGRAVLGRWQSVFLLELDGPRDRRVCLTVMGHEIT